LHLCLCWKSTLGVTIHFETPIVAPVSREDAVNFLLHFTTASYQNAPTFATRAHFKYNQSTEKFSLDQLKLSMTNRSKDRIQIQVFAAKNGYFTSISATFLVERSTPTPFGKPCWIIQIEY
jgi:hypothetical protein